MATKETLAPNYHKLDVALRSIGYSFESAVADVVDNSIDASAKNVLIRLIQLENGQLDLAVIDDGRGMSTRVLKEALRFGTDVNREFKRLGKFGLGLKLASLSQARELRVISKQGRSLFGRGWLEDGIRHGFESTIFTLEECDQIISEIAPDVSFRRSGTVVYWSNLYRIGVSSTDADAHAERVVDKLQNRLRLSFHRFLQGRKKRIRISIDVFRRDTAKEGVPYRVHALNPFGYRKSGLDGYPKIFNVKTEGDGAPIRMVAHIWPPNSDQPEYKLPGGANSRQGFYFYRNDRLIQAGGWNGQRETEPHSSLARVEVDLDPKHDLAMSLDVKKSEIHLPPALAEAMMDAVAADGTKFRDYLSAANETYRTKPVTADELPLVPARGVPSEMREVLFKVLRLPQTTKHRKIHFEWGDLPDEKVFWVDQEEDTIILNKEFRRALLHGLPGSATDLPAIKCLLFLLAQDAFSTDRIGKRLRLRLEIANLMLRESVKHERQGES